MANIYFSLVAAHRIGLLGCHDKEKSESALYRNSSSVRSLFSNPNILFSVSSNWSPPTRIPLSAIQSRIAFVRILHLIPAKSLEENWYYFNSFFDSTSMYPLNTKRLAELLWKSISDIRTVISKVNVLKIIFPYSFQETRIRTYLTDLYFILYGFKTPTNFCSFWQSFHFFKWI